MLRTGGWLVSEEAEDAGSKDAGEAEAADGLGVGVGVVLEETSLLELAADDALGVASELELELEVAVVLVVVTAVSPIDVASVDCVDDAVEVVETTVVELRLDRVDDDDEDDAAVVAPRSAPRVSITAVCNDARNDTKWGNVESVRSRTESHNDRLNVDAQRVRRLTGQISQDARKQLPLFACRIRIRDGRSRRSQSRMPSADLCTMGVQR